jgi:zinc protease
MLINARRVTLSLMSVAVISLTATFLPPDAVAATRPKGVAKVTSVEGITEYRLDNGLKVLLFPDMSKPTVTVNMTYLVGSRHENYGETGMAHLLEHMLFKGTPKNPKIDEQFNKRGMQSNGSTWLDRTNYYELFQAGDDNLKWAIDLEADRMIHSNVSRKDLDSEMTVVRNEMENGENSPFSVLIKRMQSIAYDWHSYGRSTIGNRSDVENVRIENLQAFYRTWYQPDNAVLLVAGKIDEAKTLSWIANAFKSVPKPTRVLPPAWTVEPTQDGERNFFVRRKGDLQVVALAYKIPSALNDDSDALEFAGEILADTPNGRLHKELVLSGRATEVFSYGLTGVAPGLQMIGAIVKLGEPIEPVRDALIAAVENFSKTPPTKDELERVKRDLSNQLEQTMNDHEKVGVAMSEAIALGDWRLMFKGRDDIQKVTAEQVSAAAATYFKRDNRVVGIFEPEDAPQRAEIAPAPTVAQVMKNFKAGTRSDNAEAFDPTQANINARTKLARIGGLDVALLPKKNRGETVAVSLTLHWGDEKTLFGKRTIAQLTNGMLMRGNSKFSREQLADEFSRRKISGSLYRFETTKANLADALRLVAQVLKEPNFPEAGFQELVKESLVALEAARNDPPALASQAMSKHFDKYPKGDYRASESIEESIAAIKAVKLDELKAFHRDFYGASHGELAIVGDFDPEQIAGVIDASFGSWKSAAPYTRLSDQYNDIAPVRAQIDTPDKENGYYAARVNLPLRDDDADFPALLLADYLFGGGAGLNSHLMERVRQKEGLSYGIGSSLQVSSFDKSASFAIAGIAAPQNLAKLELSVKDELAKVLKQGFTAEEIARAKSGYLQQRLQARAQDSAVAAGWNAYQFAGRNFSWSKALEDKIAALTTEQVNAAFRRAIDPARLTVIIAGDGAKARTAAK